MTPGLRRSPWRWPWQLAPVFLPAESHGQRSLVGYSPLGRKPSDTIMHVPTQASQNRLSSVSYFLFFRERHTLPLAHTHPHNLTRGLSQSLHCASQHAHPLSHTTSAVCFEGVLVQEGRGTSVLLVPVKWCVEPRKTHLSRPHGDEAEPAPVLSWTNMACSLEMGKCRNWLSLWMA